MREKKKKEGWQIKFYIFDFFLFFEIDKWKQILLLVVRMILDEFSTTMSKADARMVVRLCCTRITMPSFTRSAYVLSTLLPLWLLWSIQHVPPTAHAATTTAATPLSQQINDLLSIDNYRVYPRRSVDEAAVIEWGHSAVISALEASVAQFGPQTHESALLEVETMPVLASPINGVQTNDEGKVVVRPLKNADQVDGKCQ